MADVGGGVRWLMWGEGYVAAVGGGVRWLM